MKSIFFFFFFFFTNGYAHNRSKEIDSINKLIEKNHLKGDVNPDLTLKHVTALYYISHEAKFYPGKVNSIFEELKIYYLRGNFDASLAKISEGIDLAKERNDYNMLSRFLLIYHKVLLQLDHLNAAKKILAKSEEYNKWVASREDQLINTIYILVAQADLIAIQEDFADDTNKIIELKRQAYSECLKINYNNRLKKTTLIFTLQSLAASLSQFERNIEAKKYINLIEQLLNSFPDHMFIIQNLIIKGRIEKNDENYDKAINYFSLALMKSKNNNIYKQYELYAAISETFGELKDFEKAALFSKKYKHLIDSIDFVKKKSGDVDFINKINFKALDKNNKSETIVNTLNILITGGISLFILISIFLFYKTYNKKKKVSISQNETQFDIPQDSILLNNHLETFEITNKNLPSENRLEATKELVLLAKVDINAFYIEFQKIYPTFYQSLKDKYQELNKSDIDFCSLIKMNFRIKEISQYTNSTIRAAEARRYRIIKKMQLDNQDNLYMIISTIM